VRIGDDKKNQRRVGRPRSEASISMANRVPTNLDPGGLQPYRRVRQYHAVCHRRPFDESGCDGVPSGAARSAGRYVTFVDTADHFSIAVPNAWRRIDLSTPGASQTLRDLVAANPGLRALLGSNAAALIAQGIKFYALNANEAAVPTVNVVARPAVGIRDSDLPRIAATLKAQYATIGATVSRISASSVAGHTALQVAVTTRAVGPTGAAIAKDEIQDFVAANDFIYILTLAGTSPEFRTIAATLDVS
jgi:hypothetical protein